MGAPCYGLKENPEGLSGQHFHFYQGHLVSHAIDGPQTSYGPSNMPSELTPPYAVYGDIFHFWNNAGEFTSTYGRAICDEQSTIDGGRCSIFEGGHIHWLNGEARAYVR